MLLTKRTIVESCHVVMTKVSWAVPDRNGGIGASAPVDGLGLGEGVPVDSLELIDVRGLSCRGRVSKCEMAKKKRGRRVKLGYVPS